MRVLKVLPAESQMHAYKQGGPETCPIKFFCHFLSSRWEFWCESMMVIGYGLQSDREFESRLYAVV